MTTIPKAVLRTLQATEEPYALILFLDQKPYTEIATQTLKYYTDAIKHWRKNTLPTLKNSDVQFFVKNKQNFTQTKRP